MLAPSMAGIKYARLENDGLQWPCPNADHPGTPTLHKDGKFTRGLGMLKAIDYIPPAEVPDKEYPLFFHRASFIPLPPKNTVNRPI